MTEVIADRTNGPEHHGRINSRTIVTPAYARLNRQTTSPRPDIPRLCFKLRFISFTLFSFGTQYSTRALQSVGVSLLVDFGQDPVAKRDDKSSVRNTSEQDAKQVWRRRYEGKKCVKIKGMTYSLSRKMWYSSSPTLTGEPPYYHACQSYHHHTT